MSNQIKLLFLFISFIGFAFSQYCQQFNDCEHCYNAGCFWQLDAPAGFQCNESCLIADASCFGNAGTWNAECPDLNATPGMECGGDGIYDCTLSCINGSYLLSLLENESCDVIAFGPALYCEELGYDCGACNPDWSGIDPFGYCSDCTIPGDVIQDGIINVVDIVSLVNHILNCVDCTEFEPCMDANLDMEINVLDVVFIINIILGS